MHYSLDSPDFFPWPKNAFCMFCHISIFCWLISAITLTGFCSIISETLELNCSCCCLKNATLWFMNSVGLNVFIAAIGISAGPGFVAGLKEAGFTLFLLGVISTSVPMLLAPLMGKYIFKFDPAINLGCCGGSRTSTRYQGKKVTIVSRPKGGAVTLFADTLEETFTGSGPAKAAVPGSDPST